MKKYDGASRELIGRRYVEACRMAADIAKIPRNELSISWRTFAQALDEAELDMSSRMLNGAERISLGKTAGVLVYWFCKLAPLQISTQIKDDVPDGDRLPYLAAVIFAIEVFVRFEPPPAVVAHLVYLLYTGRFNQHTLGILFDTFILMGNPNIGEPFAEPMS